MQHEHTHGCDGGPLAVEAEGPYRATVCRTCGVAIEVSFPWLPPDALVPAGLAEFIVRQIDRLQPH